MRRDVGRMYERVFAMGEGREGGRESGSVSECVP